MSNVYGRKVTEPKVTSRTRQPFSSRTSPRVDLERTWTNLGEAKSMLEKLEANIRADGEGEGASSRKKARRVVRFNSNEEVVPERPPARYSGRRLENGELHVEDMEGGEQGEECMVNPAPLNSPSFLRAGASPRSSRTYTRSHGRHEDGAEHHLHVSHQQQHSSGPRMTYVSSTTPSSADRTHQHSTVSSATYSACSTTCTSPRGSAGLTTPYQPKNLAWSDSGRHGRAESASRKMEGLREAMEEQKRAVSMATDRISKLQAKPGYYPLSEASANNTPLHSVEPTPRQLHPFTSPSHSTATSSRTSSHYTRHKYSVEKPAHSQSSTWTTEDPPRKRKVATAPPVESSFGFHVPGSETLHKVTHHSTLSSRPLTSSTYRSSVLPTWSDENRSSGLSAPKPDSRDHPLPSSRLSSYEQTVRKVHRTTGTGGVTGGRGRAGVTNSASWRIGRRIAEEVLRENKEKEAEEEDEMREKELGTGISPPSASSSLLSSPGSAKVEDGHSPPVHPPPGGPGSQGSSTASGHAHSSGREASRGGEADGITASSSSSSVLDARAEKLSSDMKQLMDELNSPTITHSYGASRSSVAGHRWQQQQLSGSGVGLGRRDLADKPWRENMKGRGGASVDGHASKRPKLSTEHVPPAERARHYDQVEVQAYIQRKSEERRKKALEKRERELQAARDKEEKLKKLYEVQRETLEKNLRQQHRAREIARKQTPSSASIHIHIRDTTSESESDVPLTAHKYLSSSWSRTPPTSSRHHTAARSYSTSPSALPRSAAPTYHHTHTSPPRYSSFHTSPATTTHHYTSSREYSYKPSPRTVSATRTHSRESPYQRGVSPRERGSALSTPRPRDETTPSISGYVRYKIGPMNSSATPHLRSSPALGGASLSPEERLQAITAAAQDLKEKILEQSNSTATAMEKEQTHHSQRSRVSWRGEREDLQRGRGRTRLPAHISDQPTTFGSHDLPGVGTLQSHASQAARARKENEAARKIQAAFRGYVVRKSLHWGLPSGGSLKDTMQGARKGGDGGEEVEENGTGTDDTLTPTEASSVVELGKTTLVTSTTQGAPLNSIASVTPAIVATPTSCKAVPSVSSEPWKKSGGDAHSVINIFAHHHQQSHHLESGASGHVEASNSSTPSVGVASHELPDHLWKPSLIPVISTPASSSVQDRVHSTGPLLLSSPRSLSEVSPSGSNLSVGERHMGHSSGGHAAGISCLNEMDEILATSQVWSMPGSTGSIPSQDLVTSAPLSQASLTPTPPQSASVTPKKKDSKPTENVSLSSVSSRSKNEEEEDSISAITPPGSSGLVDAYTTSSSIPRLASPLPEVLTSKEGKGQHNTPTALTGGRYSPRSLDLKLQAELNHLDVVTSTIGHVSEVERTRAVSLAQQETVNVAQLLKAQKEAHKKEMEEMTTKADREKEQRLRELAEQSRQKATRDRMVDETRRLRGEMEARMRDHDSKVAMMLDGSTKVMAEVATKLQEAKSSTATVSTGVSEEPRVSMNVVRGIAESAASAAAREAVSGVLSSIIPPSSSADKSSMPEVKLAQPSNVSSTYEETFEAVSTTHTTTVTEQLDTRGGSVVKESSEIEEELDTDVSDECGTEKSEISEELEDTTGVDDTDVEEEEEEDDDGGVAGLSTGGSVVNVTEVTGETRSNEEDMKEVLRKVMPSETHRRHHQKMKPRPHSPSQHDHSNTSSAITSDTEDFVVSPRAVTPSLSDVSVVSNVGEDSFFKFMSRMVHMYMKEEEVRAKHQTALLQLREKAIKERTEAELEWLKLREKELKSKGADEQMPPLKKREKGLLRKLQQEQAEIQTLKQVQEAARQERKMMMLQHKEITKMRQSTEFYRHKISKYRRQAKAATPTRVGGGGRRSGRSSPGTDQLLFSDRESSAAPSEHFDESFTSSPVKATYSSEISEMLETMEKSAPASRTTAIASLSMATGSQETASGRTPKVIVRGSRSLEREEQELLRRSRAAATALEKQKNLLEHEQRLSQKDSKKAVALPPSQLRRKQELSSPSKEEESSIPEELSMEVQTTSAASKSSICENLPSSSSVPEELETAKTPQSKTKETTSTTIPSEYQQNTFESLEGSASLTRSTFLSHRVTTSTPSSGQASNTRSGFASRHLEQNEDDDIAMWSEGPSDSVTVTSEGSAIEARIHLLEKQVLEKQAEMKRVTNERNRMRKERLRKKEQDLQAELKALESKMTKMKSSLKKPESVESHYDSSGNEAPPTSEPPTTPLKSDGEPVISPVRSSASGVSQESIEEQISTEKDHQLQSTSSVSYSMDTPPLSSVAMEGTSSGVEEETSFEDTLTESRLRASLDAAAKEIEASPGVTRRSGSERDSSHEEGIPEEYLSGEVGSDSEESESELALQQEPSALQENLEQVATEIEGKKREEEQDEYEEDFEDEDDETEDVPEEKGLEFGMRSDGVEEEEEEEVEEVGQLQKEEEEEEEEEEFGEQEEEEDEIPEELEEDEVPEELEEEEEGDQEFERVELMLEDREQLQGEVEDERSSEETEEEPEQPLTREERSGSEQSSGSSVSVGGCPEDAENFVVGDEVLISGTVSGIIRFIGLTHFAEGVWVGIEIDEPKGRHDGSMGGRRYFTAPEKCGVFAPPSKLTLIAEEYESYPQDEEQAEEGGDEQGLEEDEYQEDEEAEELEQQEENATEFYGVEGDEEEHWLLENKQPALEEVSELEDEGQVQGNHMSSKEDLSYQEDSTIPEVAEHSLDSTLTASSEQQESEAPVFSAGDLHQGDSENVPSGVASEEAEASTSPQKSARTDKNSVCDRFSENMLQDMAKDSFHTMHRVWKSKKDRQQAEQEDQKRLALEAKADKVTDELLALLIQSEYNLASDIHASRRAAAAEQTIEDEAVLEMSSKVTPPSSTDLTPFNRHFSPPLSPPSPYQSPPPLGHEFSFPHPSMAQERSPPGSPPRHLSQAAAARVAAGEKSPPPTSPPPQPIPSVPTLERTTSIESIVSMLDSIKVTTAQCMVPSKPEIINEIVTYVWEEVHKVGVENILSVSAAEDRPSPSELLKMVRRRLGQDVDSDEFDEDEDGLGPAEVECRDSYLELVFQLSIETIRDLYPKKENPPVWARMSATRSQIAPHYFPDQKPPSMKDAQKRVQAALLRGQLPVKLPNVKYLHNNLRPGGKEIDYVDQMLIVEMRREEPDWLNYGKDEELVKMRIADDIFDELLMDTVNTVDEVMKKKGIF